jgi:hypothetical protein
LLAGAGLLALTGLLALAVARLLALTLAGLVALGLLLLALAGLARLLAVRLGGLVERLHRLLQFARRGRLVLTGLARFGLRHLLLGLLQLLLGLLELLLHRLRRLGLGLLERRLRRLVRLLRLLQRLGRVLQLLLGLRQLGRVLRLARLRLPLAVLVAWHRLAVLRLAFRGVVQLVEGLLLLFEGLGDVAFLQLLGGVVRVLGRVLLLKLFGLLGHLLLELRQVGAGLGLLLEVLVFRLLLAELFGRLVRLVGRLLGLVDGLGQLLGGLLRVHLVRLHGLLVGDLLRLQVVGLLAELVARLGQLVGRLFGLVGGRLRLVLGQLGRRLVLVLGGVVDLLGRVRGGVLHVLRHVLRRRGEGVLLLRQVVGLRRGLRLVAGLLGVVGQLFLLLGQVVELVRRVVQLGDVISTLLDLGQLLLQPLLGLVQRLQGVVLLRGGGLGVLLRQRVGRFFGVGRGLLQRLLHLGLVREWQVLHLVRGLGDLLLLGGGRLERVRLVGVLLRRLGRRLLLLDQLVHLVERLLGGGQRVGLLRLGLGDQLVQVGLRLGQLLAGLLLDLGGGLLILVFPQLLLGLPHVGLGRLDLVRHVLRHLLGRLAGVAGVELDLRLGVGQLVRHLLRRVLAVAGVLHPDGVRVAVVRVPLLRLLLKGRLGLHQLLDFVAGVLQRGQLVLRRAEGGGQRLQVVRHPELPLGGGLVLAVGERHLRQFHVGDQLAAATAHVRRLQPLPLVRGEFRLQPGRLADEPGQFAPHVGLRVGQLLAVVDVPLGPGGAGELVAGGRFQVQVVLVAGHAVQLLGRVVERLQHVEAGQHPAEGRDHLAVLVVGGLLLGGGGLLVRRLHRLVQVVEDGRHLPLAQAGHLVGHLLEQLVLGRRVELLELRHPQGGGQPAGGGLGVGHGLLLGHLLGRRVLVGGDGGPAENPGE